VVNLFFSEKCPSQLGEYIASAHLTHLVKPGGGIRRITVGTVWRRLFSKILRMLSILSTWVSYLRKLGCDALRFLLGLSFVTLDLLGFIMMTLFFGLVKGFNKRIHWVLCCLPVALHPLVQTINQPCELTLQTWYLDDGTIVGDTLMVAKALDIIKTDGLARGLFLKVDKTKLFRPVEDPRSRLVSDQSSNPTSSMNPNLKGRNRRHSKQRVENSNLEEHSPPVVTMVDQRTMAELLRAPTEGAARQWLEKEPPRSIHTWEDFVSKFINEFFPPSRTTNLNQDSLNTAAGGNLLERSTQDVSTIIENKSKQTSAVTTAMTAMLKQFQATPPLAPVKAVEETCVTCGVAINYNQGNPGYHPLGSGSLPSNTIANLKGEFKAITTRSGLVIDGPTVPTHPQSINPKVDKRVEETFTNPDLAEYTIKKMLKALLSNKEKLQELANTPLNENCPAVILKKLPEKLGDPGKFLISYGFSELKYKALANLGDSINLMPLSVWKKLGLPELIPTRMTLELANSAIYTPTGIARDIFVLTGHSLIDVHGEEMILRDGDERLNLNMRHDTSSYSNQPHKESTNLINVFNNSSADFLEDLLPSQPSGNPTFSPHPELTSLEDNNDIFDSKGCNVLSEKLLDLDSTKDLHPALHDNPLSGSTTYLLEDLKDSIDQKNRANLADVFVDYIPEMFTNKHTLDYSSPLIFDEYDDYFLEVESDAGNVYDDPFDSNGEKIKESKLLIDELDLPCDFLPPFEYDSFISQDFSKVDALPSTNNEDKIFNTASLGERPGEAWYCFGFIERISIPMFSEGSLYLSCNAHLMDQWGDHAVHCSRKVGMKFRHNLYGASSWALGVALHNVVEKKKRKYASIREENRYKFIPFTFSTFGEFDTGALDTLSHPKTNSDEGKKKQIWVLKDKEPEGSWEIFLLPPGYKAERTIMDCIPREDFPYGYVHIWLLEDDETSPHMVQSIRLQRTEDNIYNCTNQLYITGCDHRPWKSSLGMKSIRAGLEFFDALGEAT
nr:hypothetical protein [Tanacetum cinerariifolium]